MKTNVYKLMLSLIDSNKQTKEDLLTKTEVFHSNARLSDDQYALIVEKINSKFKAEETV